MRPRSPEFSGPALRRAFFCLGLFWAAGLAVGAAPAQRPEPKYVGGKQPDQSEGKQALAEFRQEGIAGDYWLQFQIRYMPFRQEEVSLTGEMWGTRNSAGPVTRLTFDVPGTATTWLLQGGPRPAAWKYDATLPAKPVESLSEQQVLQAIQGTSLTLFDLQMPFLYWDDNVYEGLANIRGRPAYSLILYPPADFAAANPGVAAVRAALDTQFHALVQAAILGPDGKEHQTITVLDLKKIGEQWMVKEIDLRNLDTRDKTRFLATGAALSLSLPPAIFTPDGLLGDAPVPEPGKIKRF
ncbi:MAG TPA: outer membrane lipoprotein-sorting protein [Candidatus Didemnitutus sp.]|nr:outer membrane lipoprotein-sorting protein [Candidatus Didemnitutus sp.]